MGMADSGIMDSADGGFRRGPWESALSRLHDFVNAVVAPGDLLPNVTI